MVPHMLGFRILEPHREVSHPRRHTLQALECNPGLVPYFYCMLSHAIWCLNDTVDPLSSMMCVHLRTNGKVRNIAQSRSYL